VWNERFPIKAPAEAWATNNGHQLEGRSLPAEFMGWVEHELELGRDPIVKKQAVLTLCADPEVVDRRIHGTVTIEYTWTPDLEAVDAVIAATGEPEMPLVGSLQVTLVGAEHLINLDLHSHNSASNPYVTVLCYPKAPWEAGDILWPTIWRTPTRTHTTSPKWNVTHNFDFDWTKQSPIDPDTLEQKLRRKEDVEDITNPMSEDGAVRHDKSKQPKIDKAIALLGDLGSNINRMKEDVATLQSRVDQWTKASGTMQGSM